MSRYHRATAALNPPSRWFHGTSAPEFSRFRPGEAYLTDDPAEAAGFAEGGHLGGAVGGELRVLEVSLTPGPVADADNEVDLIVMDEHPELDDIDDLMARLRDEGYRYADFTHPGFAGGDIRVRVSLHPEDDLDIVPTRGASSAPVPARTDKGLDVLVEAEESDGSGTVRVTDPVTGRSIGTLDFDLVSDEWHRVGEVEVDEAYRRRGVATLMYDWVERRMGKWLLPSDTQSDEAVGFWTDRIGPYDPLDEDHGFDEETTASLARSAASLDMERAIESRGVRADALLDALDLADDLTERGADVSPDGIVTLYHRTDPEIAEEIARTGRMLSREDRVFFGTSPTGQIEGHGDAAVRVRMPLERLELQTVMPGEAFVTVMSRGRPVRVDAEVVTAPKTASDGADVLSMISAARRRYKSRLFGGNCGQFAIAMARFLKDSGAHPDPRIGLIHDGEAQDEEELRDGEPDIYHVFLQLGGDWYDGTGRIDRQHLIDFADAEYGDARPDFATDLPTGEGTRRIISFNTAWDTEWTDFYRFLESLPDPREASVRAASWWSGEMLDHKLGRLDLGGRDAARFRALCEKFLDSTDADYLQDMCYWAASFLGAACREMGVPMRVATGTYTPEGEPFGHAWLEDASGTPFDITAVAHAEYRRQTRSSGVTGVAAFCPDCGRMSSGWNRDGDCECGDPRDPVERTRRFPDEDEMMEAGYECIDRDPFPEWVPGFVGPDRYDGASGDDAEEDARQLGFDEEQAEDAREMAREVLAEERESAEGGPPGGRPPAEPSRGWTPPSRYTRCT